MLQRESRSKCEITSFAVCSRDTLRVLHAASGTATAALYKSVCGSPRGEVGPCPPPQRPGGDLQLSCPTEHVRKMALRSFRGWAIAGGCRHLLPCGVCPQSVRPPVGGEMPNAVSKAQGRPPGETLRGEGDDSKPSSSRGGGSQNRACVLRRTASSSGDPMDCGPPGSAGRGILQATIREWVAIPFSRGPSQPRDRTGISCITGQLFTTEPAGKPSELQTDLKSTTGAIPDSA